MEIIKRCLDNTAYLKKRIEEIPNVKAVVDPVMNVLGLTLEDDSDISVLNEELSKKRWKLGEFKTHNFLRIVCMPHVTRDHLNSFCEDLIEILKKMY